MLPNPQGRHHDHLQQKHINLPQDLLLSEVTHLVPYNDTGSRIVVPVHQPTCKGSEDRSATCRAELEIRNIQSKAYNLTSNSFACNITMSWCEICSLEYKTYTTGHPAFTLHTHCSCVAGSEFQAKVMHQFA